MVAALSAPTTPEDDAFVLAHETSLSYRGWVIVFAAFVSHVTTLGVLYSQGVLYAALLADPTLGADRASGAVFGAAAAATQLLMGFATGASVARFGSRRVALAGAVLLAGGLALVSTQASLAGVIFSFSIFVGGGIAFSFQPAVYLIPLWFRKKRGLAVGIAVSGSGIGTLVIAQILSFCIEAYGWRAALRQLSVGIGIVQVGVAFLLAPPPKRASALAAADADKGAAAALAHSSPPDGAGVGNVAALAHSSPSPAGVDEESVAAGVDEESVGAVDKGGGSVATRQSAGGSWASMLADPALWPILVCTALYGMGLFTVYGHIVAAVADLGLSSETGASAVSAMGLAGAAGRLAMGVFADAQGGVGGRARLCTACLIIAGLAVLALGAAPPLRAGSAYVLCVSLVFGFFSGSVVAQFPPLIAELVGLEKISIALGLVYTTQAPTVLAGPPLAGAFRAALGSYVVVWCAVGALMSLSPLIMLKLHVFLEK